MALPSTYTEYLDIAATVDALSATDTIIVNGEERSTLTQIASSMINQVIFVKSAGAGALDDSYAAIKAALDIAEAATDNFNTTIILHGYYRISTPLVVPNYTTVNGLDETILKYSGEKTDSPFITVTGDGSSLSNLLLYCTDNCRGVRFDNTNQKVIVKGLWIRNARQIALDLYDCWTACVDDCRISEARGMSVRTYRCNAVILNNLNLGWCSEVFSGNTTTLPNVTLWTDAANDGMDHVVSEYGELVLTDWPATDDVAAANRCLVLLNGSNMQVNNLCIQSCSVVDVPLVRCTSSHCTINHFYQESNRHHAAVVEVNGGGTPDTTVSCVELDHLSVVPYDYAPGKPTYIAWLTGYTSGVALRRSTYYFNFVTAGFMRTVGAHHTDATVSNCYGYNLGATPVITSTPVPD